MVISANAIAGGAIAAASLIVMASGTSALSVAQPAPVAESAPLAPASSMVTGGGVTLHSVNVKFPRSDSTFSGGRGADAINNDCLLCHSAAMVLDQAKLSRAEWQTEVDKMRDSYKAPFAAEDIPAIVDYLVNVKNVVSQSASRQPDTKHGAVIVAQGTAAGAPPCAQCHAFNGVSDASGAFPPLPRQYAYYIAFTLQRWRRGYRKNSPDAMGAVAKKLDDQEIAAVAAYYQQVNSPLESAAK